MSFLSSAFSGATNSFNPGGSQNNFKQADTANANYAESNKGLNSLAAMLMSQAQGGGPNLANQQLANATQQNVGAQAALMAGQRGASANPALMARQIAQRGSQIQQQQAGQSAQNVLAQQLAAQSQLSNVFGTQGSLANQNYNVAQGGINSNNQIGSQQGAQNASANQQLIGGIANAGGSLLGLAEGGAVPEQQPQSSWQNNFLSGIMSPAQAMAKGGPVLPFSPMNMTQGGEITARAPQEKAEVQGNSYKNDKIPAMVSEDEVVLPREVTQSHDAPMKAAQFMAQVMAGKHRVRK